MQPPCVLSFDVGLRNLAIAHLRCSNAAIPPELSQFAHPKEPLDAYRARCFAWFVRHGWALLRWEVLDVSEALDRDKPVKNVKRLTDATKAMALVACLQAVEASWFGVSGGSAGGSAGSSGGGGSASNPYHPTIIAVEAQHNANAIMRGVAMGIMVHLHRSFPAATLALMSGGQKLKVCTALGVDLGAGIASISAAKDAKTAAKEAKAAAKLAAKEAKIAAKEAKAAAKAAGLTTSVKRRRVGAAGAPNALLTILAAPEAVVAVPDLPEPVPDLPEPEPEPEPKPKPKTHGMRQHIFRKRGKKADPKYDDNKQRAILAARVLFPAGHPVLEAHADKQDDLCDALLMGIMALWDAYAWPTPRRAAVKRTKPGTS